MSKRFLRISQLTAKGVQIARLSKPEAAYHKADAAIQNIVDLLAAA